MNKRQTSGVDLLRTSTKRPAIIIPAEREVKNSCSSGMFQSCNFGTSECPEVASALVPGIFELFDVFFQGKN